MHGSAFIRPKKSLGQNFLRDENVARKIIAAIDPRGDDTLLEIGPGEGALTKYLVSQVKALTVVDIDERVIRLMRTMYPREEVEILQADFLAMDLSRLVPPRAHGLRIVGNIPYNITSPILFHILEHRALVRDVTIMMQKEVARRLIAVPRTKAYGILSVFTQMFAEVQLLFDVPPKAFYPAPAVTSSVVRLEILESPRYVADDEEFFRRMVRAVFGKRRKTLRNSLAYFAEESGLQFPALANAQRRPEELTIKELVELGNYLSSAARGL